MGPSQLDGHGEYAQRPAQRGGTREVLAPSEQQWTRYFAANSDSPEAKIGDALVSFFTWAAQQELESIGRSTKVGLEKATAHGKILGTPRTMSELQVAMARSYVQTARRSIGALAL